MTEHVDFNNVWKIGRQFDQYVAPEDQNGGGWEFRARWKNATLGEVRMVDCTDLGNGNEWSKPMQVLQILQEDGTPCGCGRGEHVVVGFVYCPETCDPDCDIDCHEEHILPRKRNHDPAACPSRVC